MKKVLTIAPLAVAFIACSAVKNMDEMKDTTKEMNGTTRELLNETKGMGTRTEKMAAQTEQMAAMTQKMHDATLRMEEATKRMAEMTAAMDKKTERMAELTEGMSNKMDKQISISRELRDGELQLVALTSDLRDLTGAVSITSSSTYKDLRQGNSMTIRAECLQRMQSTSSMEDKIGEAGKYVMSFEFQLWKGVGTDDLARRDQLADDAAMEFFKTVNRYFPKDLEGWKVNPSSQDDNDLNLMALATALEVVNQNQIDVFKKSKVVPLTLLAIIQDGLAKKALIEQGKLKYEDAPIYVKEVIEHEVQAINILQLRYNFLTGLVLSKITDLPEKPNLGEKLKLGKKLLLPWSPNFSKLSIVQIENVNLWLKWAIDTRALLVKAGVQPKMNKLLKGFYSHMKVSDKAPASEADSRTRAILRFGDRIENLKKGFDSDLIEEKADERN